MLRRREPSLAARVRVALLAAAAALAAAPSAQAEIPQSRVGQSGAEVREYWTAERMAAAVPAERLLDGLPVPGALPAREVGERWVVAPDESTRIGPLDDLLGGGGGQERRAQEISNPRPAPLRTHGKVFLTFNGIDYVCSATVVRAHNKRLVTSAGHCIYSQAEGGFADNWAFVPAYDEGARPYGTWTAARLATTPQWREREDIRYDVGMAVMRKRNGKRLQRVVGARGIGFNMSPRRYHAYGYPAAEQYDGETLQMCNSRLQGTDHSENKPRPRRIECDMTGGSSGGGWVVRERVVNSVVSYGYECIEDGLPLVDLFPLPPSCDNPEEGKLFGPYFGETVRRLYRAQNG